MPKPFSVSMFKQMALYFSIYMRRIREYETDKINKLDKAFEKISQVESKLEHYDLETEELNRQMESLEKELLVWDERIESQKAVYKTAVDECRREERLIEEMNADLEKLRSAVNIEGQGQTNVTPQYDIALKAIESLNKAAFNELKTFRAPPQRVLAVMNTLCLMFRQPPGWDSGKQLLIRENFYEDLLYYDKKNVPEDIYNALSQICSVATFRPEHVRPGSIAAACFCDWILAIYEFSRFERTYGAKIKELKRQEEAYNKRLKILGEKRIKSENICQKLEDHCTSRLNVLKSMKQTMWEKERLKEHEAKAKELLSMLEEDGQTWQKEYMRAKTHVHTFKVDALLTAGFVCYAGVFGMELRQKMLERWFECVQRVDRLADEMSVTTGLIEDFNGPKLRK